MSRNAGGAALVYQLHGAKTTPVMQAATHYFRISRELLVSDRRLPALVIARHIAWFLEREAGASYPVIGEMYKRDHTTILAACNHMKARVEQNDIRYMPALMGVRELIQIRSGEDSTDLCEHCGLSPSVLYKDIAQIHETLVNDVQAFIERRLKELGVKK